jgi:hypothetical protein
MTLSRSIVIGKRGRKMYKQLIKPFVMTTAILTCPLNVYAVGAGLYMGAMTGPATNSAKDVNAVVAPGTQQPITYTPVTPQSKLWGTAIYIGYKNNQYIGSELGVDYFSSVGYSSKTNTPTAGGTSARVRDIHVLLRGSVPFGNVFEAFIKAGPAFEYITTSGGLNEPVTQCARICTDQFCDQPPLPGPECQPVTSFKSKHQTKIAPLISIGASWSLDQSWVADVTLTSLPVGSVIKNITWISVGISYHFVDRYCGQFLCP